jgi:hypothetical protein
MGDEMKLINPECRDGKHRNRTGGWDTTADEPTDCPCSCHQEAP